MAISGAKTVINNASMDYWDQSGDYYTILGGTYNYLTGISASATSVPSTGWSSTACLGNGHTISTEKSTLSVTLPVTNGTYTAAYYTNSQGSSGDMMVWWKEALLIIPSEYVFVLTYDEYITNDIADNPNSAIYISNTSSFTFTSSGLDVGVVVIFDYISGTKYQYNLGTSIFIYGKNISEGTLYTTGSNLPSRKFPSIVYLHSKSSGYLGSGQLSIEELDD